MKTTEAAALRVEFNGGKFDVGAGADGYLSVRAVELAPAAHWPTDDQLAERLGLKVRFFEAGGPTEALYAFEPEPHTYEHNEACAVDPCSICGRVAR